MVWLFSKADVLLLVAVVFALWVAAALAGVITGWRLARSVYRQVPSAPLKQAPAGFKATGAAPVYRPDRTAEMPRVNGGAR